MISKTEYTKACSCDNPRIIFIGYAERSNNTFVFECKNCNSLWKSKSVMKMFKMLEKNTNGYYILKKQLSNEYSANINLIDALEQDIRKLRTKNLRISNVLNDG